MFAEVSQTKLLQGPAIPEFSLDQIAKIDTYLIKNYGIKVAQQVRQDCSKKKDLIRAIIVKELNKTYKYPEAAFAALDFSGKGFVEVSDIVDSKIIFKLPFPKEEVRVFLETETILKKVPKLKIEMFTKFFYPTKITENKNNYDFSDSEEEEQIGGGFSKKSVDLNTIDNSSLMSTTRNREITQQIKQIEQIIKERVSNNWVSVRKAFLDLDDDYDGFLTPEDFAKLIGGSSGSQRYDFNLIKMLIKMRNRGKNSKINYTEFSQWFGQVIEPAEAFYFRHDSQKNPQYEKNMQKTVVQYAGQQKKIRELISQQNLKDRFIEKVRQQFKTTKKAFTELSKAKDGYIYYEQLQQLIRNWGFETTEDQIRELFEWLDFDKDKKISYEDLRATAGVEISPMEQLFFRQDVKPAKTINCKFEKCWENNNSNSKSAYCPLHQKVLRNLCLDRFAQMAQQIDDDKWDQLTSSISRANYQMTVGDFDQALTKYTGKTLKFREKEWIWETFKVKQYIEDNPDDINERLVSLQAFLNARKQTRMRKINELISMEEEDEQALEDIKLKGLQQVDEQFVFKIAVSRKAQWGGIWKSIKKIDRDSNGYVTAEELEELFKEYFPVELDGKSLQRYFRSYQSIQNKTLIHYKKIKDDINTKIMIFDKQEAQISNKMSELQKRTINNEPITPPLKHQARNSEEDDEENEMQLNIQGQTPAGITPLASGRPSIYDGERIIIKKKQGGIGRSITPVLRKHGGAESSRLPQQNLMVRNTSIQKLNNLTTIDHDQVDTATLLQNNRNTTPVMQRSYQLQELTRNMSALKSTALLSEYSKSSSKQQGRFIDELRNKLAYEWKNIYRGICQLDSARKGQININQFNKVVHQFKVYLSREELRKIELSYTGSQTPLGMEIDYIKLSQELGLHKGSLDYIRTKSQKFIEQMNRVKDIDSKSSLTHRLNYIKQHSTLDTSSNADLINTSQATTAQKIKSAKEFLSNMDKTRSGQISAAAFTKVARIFGLSVNSKQLVKNEVGMVDYEKQLQEFAM